jgi:hypothetical protein
MTGPAKRKGDSAELEAARLLHDLLGFDVRRQLGAGRADDVGDLTGIPDTVVQVANRPSDSLRAIHEKPLQAEVQRGRAGATFAVTMIRLRGGAWRVVLTPEQFATWAREAIAPSSPVASVVADDRYVVEDRAAQGPGR